MDDWQSIESAPLDGRTVRLKRVYKGKIVKEGFGFYGPLGSEAPMRHWGAGGLDGPIPPDNEYADQLGWNNPDGLYRFPTPTHWKRP